MCEIFQVISTQRVASGGLWKMLLEQLWRPQEMIYGSG